MSDRLTKLLALECKVSRGSVPSERAFEVETAEGRLHSSVAPEHYFWDEQGRRLSDEMLPDVGDIRGKVAARLLDQKDGSSLVSIPDGKVIWVPTRSLSGRPTGISFNVPV